MSGKEIILSKLSYKISGLLFKTHNKLGRFCREKQYSDELERILKENGVAFKREFPDGNGNRFDFIIENELLLEIKAKQFISKEDYFQVKRYLELNNIHLGLIVNFRNSYLKPKRVINTKYS